MILSLVGMRAYGVEQSFGFYTQCQGCFATHAVVADAAYFAWLGLLTAALLTVAWRMRWWLFVLIGAGLMVYCLDIAVTQSFSVRLHLSDLNKFATQKSAVVSVGFALLAKKALWLTGIVGLLALVFAVLYVRLATVLRPQQRARTALGLSGVSVLALLLPYVLPPLRYIEQNSVRNVLQVNAHDGSNQRYSAEFATALNTTSLAQQCIDSKLTTVHAAQAVSPPNVIVLVVESLSAYHSRLNGAERSSIPKLEAIIESEGAWADDFWANGFTTDGGLIAVFAGEAPIPAPGRYDSTHAFQGFGTGARDFYRALKDQRYRLAFLNGADLNFLGMGRFFRELGFNDIEDSTAAIYQTPPYADAKRGQFGAVNDDVLLRRSLQWINAQRDPFLLALLTINTHPPFVAPGSTSPDHDAAFAYADQVLAEFIAELKTSGFFNNGVLVIAGDHRAMIPISAHEQQRFGASAAARVPLFLLGKNAPRGRIAGRFQQLDLLPSLATHIGVKSCTSDLQGRVWPTPVPARFRLHASGGARDQVWVESPSGALNTFRMRGDYSSIESKDPSIKLDELQRVGHEINRQRASRGEPEPDFLAWILGIQAPQAQP